MKIEVLCENTVKLLLEAEDMNRYGLTFEEIDYNQPNTQRAFRDMMNRVRRDVGFSSEGCRLLVEARPCSDGGCVLMVTKQPLARKGREGKRDLLRVGRPIDERVLFLFERADDLLDAKTMVRQLQQAAESRLYEMDGAYYLSFRMSPEEDRNWLDCLREFGRECPSHMLIPLEERGRVLAREASRHTD